MSVECRQRVRKKRVIRKVPANTRRRKTQTNSRKLQRIFFGILSNCIAANVDCGFVWREAWKLRQESKVELLQLMLRQLT